MESRAISQCMLTGATREDKNRWGGFCEIESEPAFFNALLRDFGVHDVKIREVISLDDESLSSLPSVILLLTWLPLSPVYGLVLLFKWYDDNTEIQEQSCPDNIWFANQTVNGACASVALLNIVNNISAVDLGENLSAFRQFTQTLSPADKGDAVANFDFVKQAHNSFARRIDIQNADLILRNEARKGQKESRKNAHKDSSDAAFHFVAFMPIQDRLWKLDGLERQPICIGNLDGNDWLRKARPDIEARMLQCQEGNLGFALLSLVKDPLIETVTELTRNIFSLGVIEAKLDKVNPGWRVAKPNGYSDGHLSSLEEMQSELDARMTQHSLRVCSGLRTPDIDSSEALQEARLDLITTQTSLRMDLRESRQYAEEEEMQVEARRHDYGARMQGFARLVSEKCKR